MQFKHFLFATLISMSAAGGALAKNFGISGMNIGMNADQVIARLLEMQPKTNYQFNKWKYEDGSQWVANGITVYNDMEHLDDSENDRFGFVFTSIGSGNKLFGIRRELRFKPSQQPTAKSILDFIGSEVRRSMESRHL